MLKREREGKDKEIKVSGLSKSKHGKEIIA